MSQVRKTLINLSFMRETVEVKSGWKLEDGDAKSHEEWSTKRETSHKRPGCSLTIIVYRTKNALSSSFYFSFSFLAVSSFPRSFLVSVDPSLTAFVLAGIITGSDIIMTSAQSTIRYFLLLNYQRATLSSFSCFTPLGKLAAFLSHFSSPAAVLSFLAFIILLC